MEEGLREAEKIFRNSQTYQQRNSISAITHLQTILDSLNEQLGGKDAKVQRLEKYMTNKWVRMAVEGKFDAAALREEVTRKLLPPEVVDKLDAFEQMRRDPEGFVKEAVYSEVTNMVEANPFLKETLTKAEQLQRYIKEPQAIREDLEKEFIKKAAEYGENTPAYKKLKATYEAQEKKLTQAIEKQRKYADAYAKGAATSVQRAINESFVNQYAQKFLKDAKLTKAS